MAAVSDALTEESYTPLGVVDGFSGVGSTKSGSYWLGYRVINDDIIILKVNNDTSAINHVCRAALGSPANPIA